MKNCHSIEPKLVAFLHGELSAAELQTVEAHLADCAACRAELESYRATLNMAGEALAAAPAPERVVIWKRRTSTYREPSVFSKIWNSAQFKAILTAGVFACLFLLISPAFVVSRSICKEECKFCPPPPDHTRMSLSHPAEQIVRHGLDGKLMAANELRDEVSYNEVAALSANGRAEPAAGFAAAPATATKVMPLKKPMVKSKAKVAGGSTRVVSKTEMAGRNFAVPELCGDAKAAFGKGLMDGFNLTPEPEQEHTLLGSRRPSTPPPAVETPTINEPVDAESDAVGYSGGKREKKIDQRFRDEDRQVKRRELKPAVFNPYVMAEENAFSTFSIDVDTAAYGLARQHLLAGGLPEPELVRTEEFINSFDYDYRPPSGKQTFAVHSEMAPSPFRTGMELLKVGIKGRRIGRDDHCGATLTLVIDTSGSMGTSERLGLVKQSLSLLMDQLGANDQVAIVQFGGEARLICEHTPVSKKAELLAAIEALQTGGPTQFDQGLELGYQVAINGFRAGDSNRIMILSDGVANLGELDPVAILEQVAEQRKKGIYLSVLGFGAGAYDDDLLEQLANRGDGMYVYIDTLDEARLYLVDQLAATLHVIASDVKIQVEFNPARVLRYRQLGYENRQLTKEQFRDDTVDAGEVGSGQSVTALYDVELNPHGSRNEAIATVYVRYRRADTGAIEEISQRVKESARYPSFEDADVRFQLAACTAEFAERLRRSPYTEGTEIRDIAERFNPVAQKLDQDKQIQELLRLMRIADQLER